MVADEDDIGFAEGGAVGVDAADAFFEGGCLRFRGRGAERRSLWLGVRLVCVLRFRDCRQLQGRFRLGSVCRGC